MATATQYMSAEAWQFIEDTQGTLHLGADGLPLVLVSEDLETQLRYERMRRDGTSHALAEMFALGQPPGIKGTDSVFLEGHANGNQFAGMPALGDRYRREAAAAGVDVTGKVYLGGLAAHPGDPEAWVSGTGDVKRVCESRGWGCRGAIDVKSAEQIAPPAKPHVAPDIVEAKVNEILSRQVAPGDRPRVDLQDLREQVTERLKPQWKE